MKFLREKYEERYEEEFSEEKWKARMAGFWGGLNVNAPDEWARREIPTGKIPMAEENKVTGGKGEPEDTSEDERKDKTKDKTKDIKTEAMIGDTTNIQPSSSTVCTVCSPSFDSPAYFDINCADHQRTIEELHAVLDLGEVCAFDATEIAEANWARQCKLREEGDKRREEEEKQREKQDETEEEKKGEADGNQKEKADGENQSTEINEDKESRTDMQDT